MLRYFSQCIPGKTAFLPRNWLTLRALMYSTTTPNFCSEQVGEVVPDSTTVDSVDHDENLEIQITVDDANRLRGRQAPRKQFLMALTGCTFEVNDIEENDTNKIIRFFGDLKTQQKGKETVESALKIFKTGAREDQTVLRMSVDKKNIGTIIGKGGSTRKLLQTLTKCRIIVEGKNPDEVKACVDIIGMEENVKKGKELVEMLLENSVKIERHTMIIPSDKVNAIFGDHFVNVKFMQELSNCHLQVYKDTSPNTIVHIAGDQRGIQIVKDIIENLLKNCTGPQENADESNEE